MSLQVSCRNRALGVVGHSFFVRNIGDACPRMDQVVVCAVQNLARIIHQTGHSGLADVA